MEDCRKDYIYRKMCKITHFYLDQDSYNLLVISPWETKGTPNNQSCYIVTTIILLALSVGQKLCIDFFVPIPANFLTTLRSHMDVICSCYFWSSLRMNVEYSYNCSFS